MRYHLTPIRMAISKRKNKGCWQVCGVIRILGHCWWECKIEQSLQKPILYNSSKILNTEFPHNVANPLLDIYLK